jgi:predicted nucleic acid-binding Zn ribbon protein
MYGKYYCTACAKELELLKARRNKYKCICPKCKREFKIEEYCDENDFYKATGTKPEDFEL